MKLKSCQYHQGVEPYLLSASDDGGSGIMPLSYGAAPAPAATRGASASSGAAEFGMAVGRYFIVFFRSFYITEYFTNIMIFVVV